MLIANRIEIILLPSWHNVAKHTSLAVLSDIFAYQLQNETKIVVVDLLFDKLSSANNWNKAQHKLSKEERNKPDLKCCSIRRWTKQKRREHFNTVKRILF